MERGRTGYEIRSFLSLRAALSGWKISEFQMNDDAKEVKKGALSELGKFLIQCVFSVLGFAFAFLGITKETIMAWLKHFHFTDATISHIRFWFCIVGLIIVIVCVVSFIRLVKRKSNHQQPLQPQPRQFPASPDLSKSPRSAVGIFGIEMTAPSDMAFHVLKLFSQAHRDFGAMSVKMVSYRCQISEDEALACVKELWNRKFIRTVSVAPGEWNSDYAITQEGRRYVAQNAT